MKKNKQFVIGFTPCFNERRSLPVFLERLSSVRKALRKKNVFLDKFVIIDDCSTDGSKKVLKNLESEYDFLKVMHHSSNVGAAKTVLEGYGICLRLSSALPNCIILRMDVDLEHPPEIIPTALACLENNSSLVVVENNFSFKHEPVKYVFNKLLGREEGKKILGKPFSQFCPGMIAVKSRALHRLWLKLLNEIKLYQRVYEYFPVTLDLFIVGLAKSFGEKIDVVSVPYVDVLKKPVSAKKFFSYLKTHSTTMAFFKKRGLLHYG